MKRIKEFMIIGGLLIGVLACIREKNSDNCPDEVIFEMKDVPYVFEGSSATAYRPYYVFIGRLDILAFNNKRLETFEDYNYEYCFDHPEIPFPVEFDKYTFLFVSNLYDHKALSWNFDAGELEARFSIIDHEEPPVFLMATVNYVFGQSVILPVNLIMLVSRLEIRLENPPVWVTGLEVDVEGIARTVTNDFLLRDTTHIYKNIVLDNSGPRVYWLGVNTFPTYENIPARVTIDLVGVNETSPLIIDDSRLHLIPGVITRLNLLFNTDDRVTVSVEMNGKWEVIDEGEIII